MRKYSLQNVIRARGFHTRSSGALADMTQQQVVVFSCKTTTNQETPTFGQVHKCLGATKYG